MFIRPNNNINCGLRQMEQKKKNVIYTKDNIWIIKLKTIFLSLNDYI